MPPAALELLAALLEVGPEGATREYLVLKAGIATSTFYRVLKPLLQQGLVVEDDRRYRMPLDNLHNFRFKQWLDAQHLYGLPVPDRNAILDIVDRAARQLRHNLLALWLVGSAARGRFTAESDLDFLVVVREDTAYEPEAHRPINFVVLTEEQFQRQLEGGDDFILAALRSGLLLYDAGFAQAAYEKPIPVTLSAAQAEEARDGLERHRQRMLRFLQVEDETQAMSAVQALAIKTAWLMLRTMNVLPPPKAELVSACERFFGSRFAGCIEQAIRRKPLSARRQLQLAAQLHEYHRRFNQHLSHLKAYAPFPSAGWVELEQLCVSLLRELLPDRRVESGEETPLPVDVAVRNAKGHDYVIQCVSLARDVEPDQVVEFKRKVSAFVGPDTRCVLVVNGQRDVPVLERAAKVFADDVAHAADEHGVLLLSGMQLLRAHNELHLEELPAARVVAQLVGV